MDPWKNCLFCNRVSQLDVEALGFKPTSCEARTHGFIHCSLQCERRSICMKVEMCDQGQDPGLGKEVTDSSTGLGCSFNQAGALEIVTEHRKSHCECCQRGNSLRVIKKLQRSQLKGDKRMCNRCWLFWVWVSSRNQWTDMGKACWWLTGWKRKLKRQESLGVLV